MNRTVGKTQTALELTGPDKLRLNTAKPIYEPGPYQILCRVEAVGLCFSDLKLLKQFSSHVRKGEIVSGIDPEVLEEIPSYVPGEAATVPGHEAVVRVTAVGKSVDKFKPGQCYLVQTDYRRLLTANSNAAFGYNFEGALQEYVLMDERVILSPEGDSMLIPVSERLASSAAALIEPWACVEDSYSCRERRGLKSNGRMLIAADSNVAGDILANLFNRYNRPAQMTWVSKFSAPEGLNITAKKVAAISQLADSGYDDVIYFGSAAEKLESLFSKAAANGLLNIVLCGGWLGRDICCPVGRVHYGGIRIIGTTGFDATEAMENIPESGEIRKGDKINVVGAAGPMGQMHVIRNICRQIEDVEIFAADLDEERLTVLNRIAQPLAKKNKIGYSSYNPSRSRPQSTGRLTAEKFDYTVLMAPVPALVAEAVQSATKGGIINIFAGIPAHITATIDLDVYIKKGLYFIGTSGSTLEDMKCVLEKVESGRVDTNLSVAAVCGLGGAIEAIRAVENCLVAGKIIVYPGCKGLGLVSLGEMQYKLPQVAKHLENGFWSAKAEKTLLELYQE